MLALLQNNPTMATIVGVVVAITIALHVGIYLVIRRLSQAKAETEAGLDDISAD